jgi:hypothetical protein
MPWDELWDTVDHKLVTDAEWKHEEGKVAGSFLLKGCTEFVSHKRSWLLESATFETLDAAAHTIFDGKPGRVIDVDEGSQKGWYDAIFVPNDSGKPWWWGHGASMQNLKDLINGKAWGKSKADGIKKRLITLVRRKDHRFIFVLNEWKGESWWWGSGASYGDLDNVINGKAWGDNKADKIPKRLVSLQARRRFKKIQEPHTYREPIYHKNEHGEYTGEIDGYEEKTVYVTKTVEIDPHFTFIAIPWEPGIGFWWLPASPISEINDLANKNNARILQLRRYGSSKQRFTAIFVGNT